MNTTATAPAAPAPLTETTFDAFQEALDNVQYLSIRPTYTDADGDQMYAVTYWGRTDFPYVWAPFAVGTICGCGYLTWVPALDEDHVKVVAERTVAAHVADKHA